MPGFPVYIRDSTSGSCSGFGSFVRARYTLPQTEALPPLPLLHDSGTYRFYDINVGFSLDCGETRLLYLPTLVLPVRKAHNGNYDGWAPKQAWGGMPAELKSKSATPVRPSGRTHVSEPRINGIHTLPWERAHACTARRARRENHSTAETTPRSRRSPVDLPDYQVLAI